MNYKNVCFVLTLIIITGTAIVVWSGCEAIDYIKGNKIAISINNVARLAKVGMWTTITGIASGVIYTLVGGVIAIVRIIKP